MNFAHWNETMQGPQKCRSFADGSQEGGSWWCYGLLLLLLSLGTSDLNLCLKNYRESPRPWVAGAVVLLKLAALLASLYVLYHHCNRCNAWFGALVSVAILAAATVAGGLLDTSYGHDVAAALTGVTKAVPTTSTPTASKSKA